MVVVVFRAKIIEDIESTYYEKVAEMEAIATRMPGFISYKGFFAKDGERVSIHEWESEEALSAWRNHPSHKAIQEFGRNHFYEEYSLFVCSDPRTSYFKK